MNIQETLAQYTKGLGKFGYGSHPQPVRDWFVLLAVAAILLIASLSSNLWFFFSTMNGELQPPTTTTQGEVTTNAMETVRTRFEERQTEEGRYRSEYRFVDPSR